MKKQRGLKRYYNNLQTKNDDWSGLNFIDPEKSWFDLWHTHFDWYGYGNHSFKKRKLTLTSYSDILTCLLKRRKH